MKKEFKRRPAAATGDARPPRKSAAGSSAGRPAGGRPAGGRPGGGRPGGPRPSGSRPSPGRPGRWAGKAAGARDGGDRRPLRQRADDDRPAPWHPPEGSYGREAEEHEAAGRPPRGGSDVTVTLDADVARVFRGEVAVNKALRLVLQMMQVVEGPPRATLGARTADGAPRRSNYRGSPEARGFTRKPRPAADDE